MADLITEAEALEADAPFAAIAEDEVPEAQATDEAQAFDAGADLADDSAVVEALADDTQTEFAAELSAETVPELSADIVEDRAEDLAEDLALMSEDSEAAADLQIDAIQPGTTQSEVSLPEDVLADALPEDAPADFATSDDGLAQVSAEDPLPEDGEILLVADAPSEAPAEAPSEAPAEPLAYAPQTMGKGSGRYERISSRVVRLNPDDGIEAAPQPAPDPAATRHLQDDDSDAEVARLLQQAEAVMAEEETRQRQDALAAMKAAVDAVKADASAAQPLASEAYHDDLAKAVEPEPQPEVAALPPPQQRRRKTVSVRIPGVARPAGFSPPPLVLVTEQRIDRAPPPMMPPPMMPTPMPQHSAQAPATALQPSRDNQPMVALRSGRLTGAIGIGSTAPSSALPQRNIVLETPYQAAQADADDEEDLDEALSPAVESGLVRFAERIGARSTAEMLEAAAAFATCVENRAQFTRPQLMRRLMATDLDRSITREDGLRSFGTLLRTGRIQKVGRGFYVLADNSPVLPEARRFS